MAAPQMIDLLARAYLLVRYVVAFDLTGCGKTPPMGAL